MTHIYNNPLDYFKSNELQRNFAVKILNKIEFKTDESVLDIGCGDGAITSELSKRVNEGRVIGTDVSAQMIEYANKKYANQKNLIFLQMDASKNMFQQEFDIITSFNCLHWVKDQNRALCGMAIAAKENGKVFLLFSHKKSLYHQAFDKLVSGKKWCSYFITFVNPRLFFEPLIYSDMVVSAGLNIIELLEEEMIFYFNHKEQLKQFLNASSAHVQHIPEIQKDDFINDFVEDFLDSLGLTENNAIPVSFNCLQIIASKSTYNK